MALGNRCRGLLMKTGTQMKHIMFNPINKRHEQSSYR